MDDMESGLVATESEIIEDDKEEIAVSVKEIMQLLKSRGVDVARCSKALTQDGSLVSHSDNI